jgi:transposase
MSRCTAITVEGETCRAWAMRDTDPPVCPHHAGVRRPEKFRPEAVERIVQVLAAGGYPQTAATAAGVSAKTYYRWLARGADDGPEADAPYRDFRERVEKAQAEGEARAVTIIARAAADGTWQAAVWMLERRYPERWSRPSQRADVAPAGPATGPPDPFAEVDELAQVRRRRG